MRNNNLWFAFLSLALLALAGCVDATQKEITVLLSQWMGREIEIPEDMCFMQYSGEEFQEFIIPQTDYTIMSYIDTSSCFTCQMRLEAWMEFKKRVESVCPREVSFCFVFNPGQGAVLSEKLLEELKKSGFELPFSVDTLGVVSSMNGFSDRLGFHTFLLNTDNRIVAIGNPVMNVKVQDMFLRRISGEEPDTIAFTQLKVMHSDRLDFGSIPVGTSKTVKIRIKNVGEKIFTLHSLYTSCDCTTAEANWSSLKPGMTGLIK